MIYLVRRLAFVATALWLSEYPFMQIILTYFLCLAMLVFLGGARPYKLPF